MKKYLIILTALVFIACAKNDTVNEGVKLTLEDNEYKISKIIDKATNKEYNALGDWSIAIQKNNFGMFVGCNRIFGGVKQENGKLIYINTASTKMMCLDGMMAVENLVTKNLTEMSISKNGLENENIKIVFK